MRLVSYARLSTFAQSDTISAQHDAVARWAESGDHEVVAKVEDVGKSGRLPVDKRQGLLAGIRMLEAGEADGFAVRGLDRLARALHVQEAILARVWECGGRVWDISGGGREMVHDDPDDPYRTFLRQVMGAAVQLERGITVQRLRDGRRARATENGGGRFVGGPGFRYGWRVERGVGPIRHDGTRAPMWVRDEAQSVVCELALRMREDGALLREIVVELDRRGYRAARGGAWHTNAVLRAIHNLKHPPGTYPSLDQVYAQNPNRRRHGAATPS